MYVFIALCIKRQKDLNRKKQFQKNHSEIVSEYNNLKSTRLKIILIDSAKCVIVVVCLHDFAYQFRLYIGRGQMSVSNNKYHGGYNHYRQAPPNQQQFYKSRGVVFV